MPVIIPIIAGQAIIHGLRIAGLRILPYIIRSRTQKAAAQYATKKVGQKSITDTGYVVITKDPTKFKLAQKIFGKNKVFRSESILQAQSTAGKDIVPITQKILKSASPEVRITILNQADDAASGVSKFISSSKVQTVGGTKITKPFTDFFGKNLKFSKNTTEAIKIAERGPASLSKEIAVTAAPKVIKDTTKKIPEVIKLGQRAPKIDRTTPVPIKEVISKKPWYVAVMPKFLRTRKEIMDTSKVPYVRTVTEGVAKKRLAGAVAGGYGVYEGGKIISKDTPKQPHKDIDLDINELFGGATKGYEQIDITSGIDFYGEDETGNVIQAQ